MERMTFDPICRTTQVLKVKGQIRMTTPPSDESKGWIYINVHVLTCLLRFEVDSKAAFALANL